MPKALVATITSASPRHEAVLGGGALIGRHARVVGGGEQPGRAQRLGDLLAVSAGAAVDDRRPVLGIAQAVLEQAQLPRLGALALEGDDVEGEVGAVEAGAHKQRVVQAEAALDLAGHLRRGGRRAGQDRRPAEPLDRLRQPQVVGAEVVSPFRDAVRLVDGHQVDLAAAHGVEERGRAEALRRAVGDPRPAITHPCEGLAVSLRAQARGDHHRRMRRRGQGADLVGHQRDQGADDDGELG